MKRIFIVSPFIVCAMISAGCIFAPQNTHLVSFRESSCIKPYNGYSYLTCHSITVDIDNISRTIPENFDTDLASIPRWYWSFSSPNYSGFIAPAILHDYLYQCPNNYSRKTIDEIFYYALINNGVSRVTAYSMYIAVRLFGGRHYHELAQCIYKDSEVENKDEEDNEEDSGCDFISGKITHV